MSKPRQSKSGRRHGPSRPLSIRTRTATPAVARCEAPSDVLEPVLKDHRERFLARFGRLPGTNDPIFYDLDAAEPTQAHEDQHTERWNQLVDLLENTGLAQHFVHAARRMGFIANPLNRGFLTRDDIDAWDASIDEYFAWDARANEAQARGEHAAIAHAIRKSGLQVPNDNEWEVTDAGILKADGPSAQWFRAYRDYARQHPEADAELRERLQAIVGQDVVVRLIA